MSLLDNALDGLPAIAHSRVGGLVREACIKTSSAVRDSALDEAALGISCTEEGGVNGNQDPRALLEHDCRQEEAEPQEDLKNGHDGHGLVIVVLDELANCVAQTRGLWLAICGWADCWQEVGTRVGEDVEERVDAEWKDRKWHLAGEEPDECHC